MKNPLVLLAFALTILLSCTEKKDKRITIGSVESLHSEILNEQREIWVHVPDNGNDTSKHYPVLYLLDGDDHFHNVNGILDQLTKSGLSPEMIVVGLINTNRSRDFTPSRSVNLPGIKEDKDFLKTSGGAENFARFFEEELIPYIDKHYSTAPHRILFGHSLGGLFAINTLINHPYIFNSYLAIDPSLWWDNQKLLLHSDTVLRQAEFNGKTLFVSVANTMVKNMDTLQVASDTAGSSLHIRSIIHFAKRADADKIKNGLHFRWKYYHDDDHGSVALISEYDALRFIFSYYKVFFDTDPNFKAEEFTRHYENVSAKLGYKVLPDEAIVNEAGHYFLRGKMFDQAFGSLELNVKNYPKSAKVYEGMGDYYEAIDNKPKAIEFFTKSLSISENEEIRKKVEELKSKKL